MTLKLTLAIFSAIALIAGVAFVVSPLPFSYTQEDIEQDRVLLSRTGGRAIYAFDPEHKDTIWGIIFDYDWVGNSDHLQLIEQGPDVKMLFTKSALSYEQLEYALATLEIRELHVRAYELNKEMFELISSEPTLHHLNLDLSTYEPQDFGSLKSETLFSLRTDMDLLGEASTENFYSFPNLSSIDIFGLRAPKENDEELRISPAGVAWLERLPNLKTIEISGYFLDSEAISSLSSLKQLDAINLERSCVAIDREKKQEMLVKFTLPRNSTIGLRDC